MAYNYGPRGRVFGHSVLRVLEGREWAARVDVVVRALGLRHKDYPPFFGFGAQAVVRIRSGRYRPPVAFVRRLNKLEDIYYVELEAERARAAYGHVRRSGKATQAQLRAAREQYNAVMEWWVNEHNRIIERRGRPADISFGWGAGPTGGLGGGPPHSESLGAVGGGGAVSPHWRDEDRTLRLVRIPVARRVKARADKGVAARLSAVIPSGEGGVAGGAPGERGAAAAEGGERRDGRRRETQGSP